MSNDQIPQNLKQLNPPAMADTLDEVQRGTQLSINCVQIGIIQEFDAAKQLATIQIAMKQVAIAAPDGTNVLQDYPLLLQCPTITLFGGNDFMSMPIQVGDTCMVLFNDRCIDSWLQTGQVIAPPSPRVHNLSDGIAIVGIRPLTNSIATYLANGIRLSHAAGAGDDETRIDLTDALITALSTLFLHQGSVRITGDLTILGDTFGDGDGEWRLRADLIQEAGKEIHAGNGANGTFDQVTVVDGIVISGT